EDSSWPALRAELIAVLKENGYRIRNGTGDERIKLIGSDGVQNHVKRSAAYVFFGIPTIGELLKVTSLFVGLQTLDPDLHYFEDEVKYRKPVIIYGNKVGYSHLIKALNRLHKEGTIGQEVEKLIHFAETPAQLMEKLNLKVKAQDSIHGHGKKLDDEDGQVLDIGTHKAGKYPELPDFRVCGYTSASRVQDEKSITEAYKLGKYIGDNKFALVSGLGYIGLMNELHKGAVENGGCSIGSNCPHILSQEKLPPGWEEAYIVPDIYSRMDVMFMPSDFIVIAAGGRGGGGTMQEYLAALLLMSLGKLAMQVRDKKFREFSPYKPIVIDNRKGIWDDLIALSESHGFYENQHFKVVSGTDEVIQAIEDYRAGKLGLCPDEENCGF
ncbi:MAG: hypothetical protein COV36_04100, partial [Alphaproteobacteria bacterium CG11_big_fil_rev_8_21_14_0_20_44_7]